MSHANTSRDKQGMYSRYSLYSCKGINMSHANTSRDKQGMYSRYSLYSCKGINMSHANTSRDKQGMYSRYSLYSCKGINMSHANTSRDKQGMYSRYSLYLLSYVHSSIYLLTKILLQTSCIASGVGLRHEWPSSTGNKPRRRRAPLPRPHRIASRCLIVFRRETNLGSSKRRSL